MKEWHSTKFQFWRSTPPAVMSKQTSKACEGMAAGLCVPTLQCDVMQRKLEGGGRGSDRPYHTAWHSCVSMWTNQETGPGSAELGGGFTEVAGATSETHTPR